MRRVTLRLPEETYNRLKRRQRTSGQSLNELIVWAIDRAIGELADERQRIRVALEDLASDMDTALWPGLDQPSIGREEILAALPRLDPPLSQDIIKDRGEY